MRKKLFAIVMSMTMVASFMPSMAFAAHSCVYPVTVSTNTVKWADVKAALKTDDAKYINVEKEPTHNASGVAYLTCKEDYCGEVKKVSIERDPADHVVVQKDLSLQEYADAMVAEKIGGADFKNATAAAYWVKTQSETSCYRENVNVCSCGYVGASGTNVPHSTVNKKYDCVDYNCSVCDKVIKGSDHSFVEIPNANKVADATCGSGALYEAKCSVCQTSGTVAKGSTNGNAHNYGTAVSASEATVLKSSGKYDVKSGYVGVALPSTYKVKGCADIDDVSKYTFYKLNNVITEGDCTHDSTMGLKCVTCGAETAALETVTAQHDYDSTKVAATCDSRSKVKKICKVCGNETEENATTNDDKLNHSYKVTKVAATCGSAEYYVVECTTCGRDCAHDGGVKVAANGAMTNKAGTSLGNATELVSKADATNNTKTYVFTGFQNELVGSSVIELTISQATPVAHKPGDKTLLKAATCEGKEVWGKKCVECGKLIASSVEEKNNTALGHNHPVIKVDATCLNEAYEIKADVCTRCGKKDAGITAANEEIIKKASILGGEHSFDKWVETKASTVFEKGVESLVCSKCGAVDSKTSIDKLKVAKASNTVKAGKKSFNVKSSAANATGYRVYYKKAGAKSWKSYTKKTASLSKTFTKLSKGKYYVKVKAYAKNYAGDGEVVWGEVSSTKTVTVK